MTPSNKKCSILPRDSRIWNTREPMIYISFYFEANRDAYYEGLLAVSREGDWTGWSRFFPGAVRDQAEANLSRTRAIMEFYETMKVQVVDLTHSQYAVHVPDWVFGRPIFKSSDFVAGAGIPEPTAKRILAVLRNEGVVSVISAARGRRAAALAFPGLLNIAEGRDAF